jgi:hypothetical protein
MYFASFGVLAFCRSLSEKLRFWGKKTENSYFLEMGSSSALLGSSARAHNSPQPTTMCSKGAFQANGLKLRPVELERIEHSSHLHTRMCHRADIQVEWAWAHSAELAKTQTRTRTPIFLMPKAHVSLISTAGYTAFVFLVVSCKEGTLKRGKWVFLHSHQTLMLFYKAISFPPCKPTN